MSAIMENKNSVLDAQRYAISSALLSGASSLSSTIREGVTVERPSNYNPVYLLTDRDAEKNCQHFNHIYGSVNKSCAGFNNLYQFSTDTTEYLSIVNAVAIPTITVNISMVNSDSSFEKDEVIYKVRTVLSKVNNLESDNERDASRFLMRSIEKKLKVRDVIYINELLKNMSLMEFSPRCLVSALRSTYRIKHSLFMWKYALLSAEKRLSAKGLDSHAWLIGLTNDRK